MTTPKQIHPVLRIPPPLFFVVCFLAGAGLQRMARQNFSGEHGTHLVGLGLIGCAFVFVLYSVGTFLSARTTLIPFGEASKLVMWGPYRLTRNPMYVSLVVAYAGAALAFSQLYALILVVLPIFIISRFVIPFEEERMQQIFGSVYRDYCSRVRRWV